MVSPHSNLPGNTLSVEVLQHFCDGDATAFQKVHDAYNGRLLAYCMSCFPRVSAEDLVQDLWLEILRKRREFQPETGGSGLQKWIYTMLRHRGIDDIRRISRHATVTDPQSLHQQPANQEIPEAKLQRDIELREFNDCLQQLREDWQRLIRGKYQDDKSTRQLAKEEQLRENTVSTQLHRARKQLQDCINKKQNT